MKRTFFFIAVLLVLLLSSCSPAFYSVTFDSKGGSYTPRTQYVKECDTAVEPLSPARSDTFGFRRWRLEGGAEEAFDFSRPIRGNITLWAEYWPVKEIDDSKKVALSMVYYWNIIRTLIENESFSRGGTLASSFPFTNDSKNYSSHSDTEKALTYILANALGLKDEDGGSSSFSYYNQREEEQYTVYYQEDNDFWYEIMEGTGCEENASTTDGSIYSIDVKNLKIVLHGHKAGETIEEEDKDGEWLDQKDSFDNTFSSVISLKGVVKKSPADDPDYEIRMEVTVDGVTKEIQMSFIKPKNSTSEYIIHFTADGYSSYLIYRG